MVQHFLWDKRRVLSALFADCSTKDCRSAGLLICRKSRVVRDAIHWDDSESC